MKLCRNYFLIHWIFIDQEIAVFIPFAAASGFNNAVKFPTSSPGHKAL